MANNRIQVKRTSVSGRTANVTSSGNSQYIAAGELALNMPDGILYSSNGSALITVGANLVNQNISGNLTVKAIIANSSLGTSGHVLHSNGTATYWAADDQGVTSVATGNGLTGGTITTTGTVSVLANNGITANSTGLFVTSGNGTVVNATGVHVGAGSGVTVNSTAVAVLANNGLSANATGLYVTPGNGLIASNSTGVHVGAGSGVTVNSTTVAVLANNGLVANSTGLFVTPGNGLIASNSTGVHVGAGSGVTVNSTTVAVLANTGIVANATGTFVNATYIGTISANNASFLGGTAAASYQLNSTLAANVATLTSNNATFINGNNVLSVMESLRANRNLNGGGTITVDGSGNILWSARYIVISNGRGTHFSTLGYFDINCPTSGTITGVGGATNKTATAAGIPLAAWEALYYIMPIGSGATSVAANFRVAYFTSDLEIPSDWLLICVCNGDNGNYYFNNGIILKAGESYVGGSHTSTTIGSNTFTIGTGTYFVANGNVGIGNTAPTQKLHVQGTGLATSDFRAPIFYDSANTSFYVDPASTSVLNTVSYALLTGPATSTRDKIRLWSSAPYSIGMQASITFGAINNDYAITFQMNNTNARGFWWGDDVHTTAQGAMALSTDGKLTVAHSIRVGHGESDTTVPGATYRLDVSGDIGATGNITAYYSDERLKTKLGNISKAVDIIKSLNGFRYVNNETAKSFGYDSDKLQVGVSAQEVERVLPEIVSIAPFDATADSEGNIVSKTGENYKTVDYSKLVPVLVEAIKEQQEQIETLRKEINILKGAN